MEKILIIHHSVGKTDGVSLEIEKRRRILKEMGYIVLLVSGPVQEGADYILEGLALKSDGIDKEKLTGELFNIIKEEDPTHIFVHNILSLGRNIAAAECLLNVLDIFKKHVVSVNHDLYWERLDLMEKANEKTKELYEKYLLPNRSYIAHTVINSITQRNLFERKGINSTVISDVFDFDQPRWDLDEYNADLKKLLGIDENSLVILQATRIIPRKAIELTIDYAAELQKAVNANTQKDTKKRKVVILMPNYIESGEKTAAKYATKLETKAKKQDVEIIFGSKYFEAVRKQFNGQKLYSLWDAYAVADIIAYPSIIEGYGNQFLEALFARKPIVLFEYPVFTQDIKPKGYKYISLGNDFEMDKQGLVKIDTQTLTNAVHETLVWLQNPEQTSEYIEANYNIGKQNNSLETLRQHLKDVIAAYYSAVRQPSDKFSTLVIPISSTK